MQVSVRGEGAFGAGRDIKGNAFGDGSVVTNIEHQIVQEAAPWRAPSWPVLIGVIPAEAGYYQHRPLAGELAEALGSGGMTGQCQVITGTGGVGKTQLAAEYARTAFPSAGGYERALPSNGSESRSVELLLWVSATNPQAVTDAYVVAAQVVVPGGVSGLDAHQAAQQFLAWLRTTTRRWLVVLDDVTAPGTLTGLWPPEVAVGQVLVTTRSRDAAWSTETRMLLQVGMFTPDQSATYLRRALVRPGRPERTDSDGEVAALTTDLGHLPLALAQAAAYLVDTGRTISTYRALLADRARLLAHLVPEIGGLPDAQTRSVNAVWDLSLALADTCRPVGLARPMMEVAAVLDSHAIPERALTACAARSYLGTHRAFTDVAGVSDRAGASDGGAVDDVDAEDVLRILHRLNLLDSDLNGDTVRVHQLIQRAVRENEGTRAHLRDLIFASADALMEIWPDPERDTSDALLLRANAAALISRNDDFLWQGSAHPVLFRVGRSRGEMGEVQGAVEYFEHLADDAVSKLGLDHPDTLAARHENAYWRGQTGDVAETLAAYERLLTDQLRVQGPDHAHTLTARNEVVYWRGQMGDVAGAIAATEELLADQVRVLGPDDPRTFASRGNAAGWRGAAGDVAGAVAGYEALLADRLRVLGPEHPDTLATRGELAGWRGAAGDVAGAVAGYEALLADRLRVLGPEHPDTLATRNSLAAMRGYAGDAAGAVLAFEDLLTECERVLGPDHPRTLTTRSNLAFWRAELGDVRGSRSAYTELLADRLRVLGPDHQDTLAARSNLAAAQGEAGDIFAAVSSFEQLLTDRLRVLGPDHPDTLATRSNLAGWLGEAGDLRGAIAATEELLNDQLRVLGRNHPDTLATRNNLAGRRGQVGELAAAITAYEDLIVDQVRVLGVDHPDTLASRGNLAGWQGEAGDVSGARIAQAGLLTDRLRVLGPDHPDTLTTRHNLASLQGQTGDVAGAVIAYEELLADMFRILGPHHRLTFDTFCQMEHLKGQALSDPQ
ncbi:tetratricopeptide repeat protein [Streptomyces sp. NBC_00063]|uniref:tetratricopeptide repeat protein n=1 Tax=Streptomyces sp. NBC_00063 TaxID=2975638 RepID=UPI002254FA5B|nr:tetratricopeptide repeat protein [Streptomyces sp. NBC_00063]MCX5441191.1 tetratricopeptide repeat protein [Streptomyces sp. NBC_00063]